MKRPMIRVCIFMTAEQKRETAKAAQKAGESFSAYVRRKLETK